MVCQRTDLRTQAGEVKKIAGQQKARGGLAASRWSLRPTCFYVVTSILDAGLEVETSRLADLASLRSFVGHNN